MKTIKNKDMILAFIADEGSCKAADIAAHIGLSSARTRVLLSELAHEGKLRVEGNGRSRRYGLPD